MRKFINTVPSDNIYCDSTIYGECIKTKNIDDCTSLCESSPNCNWGFYNKKNNYCYPLRKELFPSHYNPYYIFKNDTNFDSFIRQQVFEIPPQRKNRIFIYDNVYIVHHKTRIHFNPSVKFISPKPFKIRPLNFIPLTKTTPILLYDGKSDVILRPGTTNLRWVKSLKVLFVPYESFFIVPVDSSEDVLYYNKNYYIQTTTGAYLSYRPFYNLQKHFLEDLTIVTKPDEWCVFNFQLIN